MIPPNPNELKSSSEPARSNGSRLPVSSSAAPPGVYLPVPINNDKPVVPPALSPSMTPHGLLKALRRRWGRALILGILFATAAAIGTYLVMPRSKYAARTMLHVSTGPKYQLFPVNEPGSENYHRAQLSLAKTRLVLNAALKQPGVMDLKIIGDHQPDPIEWLENQISTSYNMGPEFLTITMTGEDPEELKILLAAITQSYLTEVVFKDHRKRMDRIEHLRKIASDYRRKLNDKQARNRTMAELAMGARKDGKFRILIQEFVLSDLRTAKNELANLRRDKVSDELKLAQEEAREKQLKENKNPVPRDVVDREIEERDHFIHEARGRIEGFDNEIEKLRALLTEREFKKSREALEEKKNKVNEEIDKRKAELRPKVAAALRDQMLADASKTVNELKVKRDFALGVEKRLEEEVGRLHERSLEVNRANVDIDQFQEEVSHWENIVRMAEKEAETLDLEKGNPPRVTKPDKPDGLDSTFAPSEVIISPLHQSSRQLMMTGLAAVVALGLVFFAVSWWEWRAKRINTVDEVIHGLGMTVFGTLPAWRSTKSHKLIGNKTYRDLHWQSLFTESVDATRTMLLHAARQEGLRVVMVTSAVSGEGKTSLSTHLATSLARANRRTLLVDCDMRNPAAQKLFDLPLTPGFSELLRGEVSLAEVVKATTVNGLWMITAGRCDDQALQMLTQEEVRKIFEQLKEQYEFIVVDSSPILPVADSLLVGQYVDAVLLSILRDVSRIPMVYTAHQRLSGLGIRILGAVVNGAQEETSGYGYGYRYDYGYGDTEGSSNGYQRQVESAPQASLDAAPEAPASNEEVG